MSEEQAKPNTQLRGAIVAMTRERVIGIDGDLPWHYSEDLKRFKQRTMDHAIIMGRITWDSIGGKALPGRRNIVISRSEVPGVEHYHSIDKAIDACGQEDLWVIGGAQIFNAAMTRLNLLDVTYVPDVIKNDHAVKFPIIEESHWRATEESTLPGDTALTNVIYQHYPSAR